MKNLLLLLVTALMLVGCQSNESSDGAEEQALVIYSGRSKALVEALVDRYEQETGRSVDVRFGKDAELLAALQEEGDRSPADLFWANTTGALGAASNAGLLTTLPDSLTQQPAGFVPSSGLWVPVTTRFRVLAYNPQRVDSAALPASAMDLPQQEALQGRIGWTPSYSSFQDFITAMRLTQGREATLAWLEGMKDLAPKAYPSNTPMLQALAAGEIDVALTNHYYALRVTEGDDAEAAAGVAVHHFADGDVGNLALVTGAGVLTTSDNQAAAQRFLDYLLGAKAQRYAAETVYEYPVVDGAAQPGYLRSTEEALQMGPDFDFEQLRDLDATLQLMREAGLL